jgi:hypothetical protein
VGGQGGEMTQIMYADVNKRIKKQNQTKTTTKTIKQNTGQCYRLKYAKEK